MLLLLASLALAAAPALPPAAPGRLELDALLAQAPAAPAPGRPLNAAILAAVDRVSRQPDLHYGWVRGQDTDGVSQPLLWRGVSLATPEPDRAVHCSGITFEVWLQALAEAAAPGGGPDAATLLALKQTWYNRDGSERGPVDALVAAGLGTPVHALEDLEPGDLVQFWRNNGNGHTAVFIDHTRTRSGAIRGMVYWSAQSSSGGVGRRYVSVGASEAQIAPGRLYAVRPLAP